MAPVFRGGKNLINGYELSDDTRSIVRLHLVISGIGEQVSKLIVNWLDQVKAQVKNPESPDL